MKTVFLLFIAFVGNAYATDMGMNYRQSGFQLSSQLGFDLTTPSNHHNTFDTSSYVTPDSIHQNIHRIIPYAEGSTDGLKYARKITSFFLDYGNLPGFNSISSISAGLSLGYKWLLSSKRYSITANSFIQYHGTSLYSELHSSDLRCEVIGEIKYSKPYTYIRGAIASFQALAGRIHLKSGPIFGFNLVFSREFNWYNAGLLLGMKFHSYNLHYLDVKPLKVVPGMVVVPGYVDTTYDNYGVSFSAKQYTNEKIMNKMATGFTIGFSSNYYLSDTLSAGIMVFYDMYLPVTFNFVDVPICPFVLKDGQKQVVSNGQIKLQNNTIGFMMTATYSFG